MTFPRKTSIAIVAVAASLLAIPASASAYIFWSNSGGTPSIGRANDDGTSANQSFLTGISGTPAFMDIQGDWVYWGTSSTGGPIGRVKVSGANPATSFMPFTANVRSGVDITGTRIYWTDSSKKLQWADPTCPDPPASSSCKRSNVATFSSGTPSDAIFQSGHLYWSQGGSIYRVSVNEATEIPNLTAIPNPPAWKSPSGATAIEGIASDGTYLYYVNRSGAKIGRILIADGSDDANLVTNLTNGIPSPAAASPYGLDVDSKYIYWTDSANNTIGRAPIAGSSSPTGNFIAGANAPRGIAVGRPLGELSPATGTFGEQLVAGGPTAEQTFTLSSSGSANLVIDPAGIAISGDDSQEFRETESGTCDAGSSYPPGQSCTITLEFDPSAAGSKSATLSVSTNDGSKSANLSGTGWDGRYLFWTSDDGEPGFSIGRATTTGSSANPDLIPDLVGEAGLMSSTENKIYWGTEMPYASGTARIGRASVDGSDLEDGWRSFGSAAQDRAAVTVTGRSLYWLTRYKSGSSEIGRADLPDGGWSGGVVTGLGSGARAVVADESGIYWSKDGDIYRAGLDGGSFSLWKETDFEQVEGLAVDSNFLYFAARDIGVIGRVAKADKTLDPAFVSNLDNGIANPVSPKPNGLAVKGSYIYWADRANGTIGRASIAGSSSPDGGFISGLVEPTGVTVGGTGVSELYTQTRALTFYQDILAGPSPSQTVTISNVGLKDLHLGASVLTGEAASDYQLDPGSCTDGAVLAPEESCSLSLLFAPSIWGPRSATLSIPSDAPLSPESIGLIGSGADLPPEQVAIISGPRKTTRSRNATFYLPTPDREARLECGHDASGWSRCKNRAIYYRLKRGVHTFRLRATTGFRSGKASVYRWKIRK